MGTYSDRLFVHRKELDQVIDWIHKNPDREPILSLVSPPGTGKTWLLQACKEKIMGEAIIILEINLPDYQEKETLDIEKLKKWLRDTAYPQICKNCREPSFNPHAHISHNVDNLSIVIEQKNLRLLLIMDGYDEISVGARRDLDAWFILRFVARRGVSILTAYRTGCRLEDSRLRQKEERIEIPLPNHEDFSMKQFNALYFSKTDREPELTWLDQCITWMQAFKYYQWDHPFINGYLFELAWNKDGSLKTLKALDLDKCIHAVVSRPDKPSSPVSLTQKEYQISFETATRLAPTWLTSDYEKEFDVTSAHDQLDPLLDKGVIEYIQDTQRYRIAPGIYELLQDIDHLRKGVRT